MEGGMRGGEWKWGCREGSGREWRGLGKGSERRDEGREMEGGTGEGSKRRDEERQVKGGTRGGE